MRFLYKTTFVKIGNFASEALNENMLITFKEGVSDELANYCYIHSHGDLVEDLQIGDIVIFDNENYVITALGSVANKNLKELGHVTWYFDGSDKAKYPGTIHLKGSIPKSIDINSILIIKTNRE